MQFNSQSTSNFDKTNLTLAHNSYGYLSSKAPHCPRCLGRHNAQQTNVYN